MFSSNVHGLCMFMVGALVYLSTYLSVSHKIHLATVLLKM